MDGELPGVESLQIRDHLSHCGECASEHDELLSMKRLIGRLKIQEPAADITSEILQSIRIEVDLQAQRSPQARINQLLESVRNALVAPRVIGLGFGVAAIAALLYSQSITGDQVHVVGIWDHSVPPASEFTAGVQYPNSSRFISPAMRGGSSNNGVEEASFVPGIRDIQQSPPQFGSPVSSTAGYFLHAR
jgi:hypothetical protein